MFPRIHPFALDAALSRGKVFSRHGPPKLSSSASSMGREILTVRHGLRDTHIGAQFDQLKMIWSILRFFVCKRAASFLARCHWSEAFCSLSTILLASPWSLNCSEQQVPLYFLNNQRFCRPPRRTCPLLLRGY